MWNINQKNASDVLQAHRFNPLTNVLGEVISSIRKQNIVNQLGKHDFPYDKIFLVGGQYMI